MTDEGPPWHAGLARRLGAARAVHEPVALARLAELVGIVYRLRDPDGCPWDLAQSVDSMAQNLLEEAFETHEAIARGDDGEVCEELGDLLLNIVLIARIGEQQSRFGLAEVAAGIAEKLVRRHPHVFGGAAAGDAAAVVASWNAIKAGERPRRDASVLDGVPRQLPALVGAQRTIDKAAACGFDWPDAHAAFAKFDEEVDELRAAVASGDSGAIEDELGDVLFTAVALGRKAGLDSELALRRALGKFRRRFARLEAEFGDGLGEAGLDELLAVWRAVSRTVPR